MPTICGDAGTFESGAGWFVVSVIRRGSIRKQALPAEMVDVGKAARGDKKHGYKMREAAVVKEAIARRICEKKFTNARSGVKAACRCRAASSVWIHSPRFCQRDKAQHNGTTLALKLLACTRLEALHTESNCPTLR